MDASLNMPLAMQLTILVSLFAVKVCSDTTAASADEETIKGVAQPSSLHDISVSSVTTTNNTQKPIAATHPVTTAVTSANATASASSSSQTTNRTGEIGVATPPKPAATDQMSNEMVFPEPQPNHQAGSESPKGPAAAPTNTTSPGPSHKWGKDDLAENPGLVVVLLIFCIITALVLVVVTLKCIRSPRSNFEKLEDLPMGKVSETSPFAQNAK